MQLSVRPELMGFRVYTLEGDFKEPPPIPDSSPRAFVNFRPRFIFPFRPRPSNDKTLSKLSRGRVP